MCILFLFFHPTAGEDEWQLVLASNRDEYLDRPAKLAQWDSSNRVIHGTDETPGKEGGTWLGLEKSGKIGVLLNISEPPSATSPDAIGRGSLIRDYLYSPVSVQDYSKKIEVDSHKYNGFQTILLQKVKKDSSGGWEACYFTNRNEEKTVERLDSGIYGFGNSIRSQPYQKVQDGLKHFQQSLLQHMIVSSQSTSDLTQALLDILKNEKKFPTDPQMQSQCVHLTAEQRAALSSRFIKLPPVYNYGTRNHTIILIDGKNRVKYIELSMDSQTGTWSEQAFDFEIDQ